MRGPHFPHTGVHTLRYERRDRRPIYLNPRWVASAGLMGFVGGLLLGLLLR